MDYWLFYCFVSITASEKKLRFSGLSENIQYEKTRVKNVIIFFNFTMVKIKLKSYLKYLKKIYLNFINV